MVRIRTTTTAAAAAACCALALGAPPGAAHGALVGRGGFDSTFCPPDALICTVGTGETRLSPWQVTRGSVDAVLDTYWQNQSGRVSVDLAGNVPGTLRQTVTTTPGTTYRLTFWYAGNPDCGPTTKRMRVSWDGAIVAVPTADTTGRTRADLGWRQRQVLVTATGDSTVLEFADRSEGGTACGAVLDTVSLAAL